jgi:hypothetical protein
MQLNFKIKYPIIIIVMVLGYIFLYFTDFPLRERSFSVCIFKNITGIPCPACGSTRATICLLHGNVKEALLLNPLALATNIFILFSIGWMVSDLLRNKETYIPNLKRDLNTNIKIFLFVILIVNWIWNIYKGV